jgi:hypothetical protein
MRACFPHALQPLGNPELTNVAGTNSNAHNNRGVTCFAGDEAAERLAAAVRAKAGAGAAGGAAGGGAGAGAAGGPQGVLYSKKTAPPVVPNPR